jgi:hypothetical protein
MLLTFIGVVPLLDTVMNCSWEVLPILTVSKEWLPGETEMLETANEAVAVIPVNRIKMKRGIIAFNFISLISILYNYIYAQEIYAKYLPYCH